MPLYRVTIEAEFEIKATARDVVANRVRAMFKAGKFDEANFEWGVTAIKQRKEDHGQESLPHHEPHHQRVLERRR